MVVVVLADNVIVVKLPEIEVVTVEAGKVDVVVKKSVETEKLAPKPDLDIPSWTYYLWSLLL